MSLINFTIQEFILHAKFGKFQKTHKNWKTKTSSRNIEFEAWLVFYCNEDMFYVILIFYQLKLVRQKVNYKSMLHEYHTGKKDLG